MAVTLTGTNLDAPDASALASCYRWLRGATVVTDEPGWAVFRPPGGSRPRGRSGRHRRRIPAASRHPCRPRPGRPPVLPPVHRGL